MPRAPTFSLGCPRCCTSALAAGAGTRGHGGGRAGGDAEGQGWGQEGFWRHDAFSGGDCVLGGVRGLSMFSLPLFLSQAIRARAPVPWASSSAHREGLEAAVLAMSAGSPPLGLIKPTCILYLHFQAPVKTPPASNKTVQKSLTRFRTLGSQKQTPTKNSPCSCLLMAVGILRFLCR